MTHLLSGVQVLIATNMNKNNQQDTAIAVLIERMKNFEKNFNEKLDTLAEKITKMDRKLDEDYVNKTEFSPIKKLYNKLVNFSLGIIFLIGGVGVAIILFVKSKLF